MGTKVEYSINLLAAATSVDNNNINVKKSMDAWENYQNKGLSNKGDHIGTNNLQFSSMQRMVDSNNLESIRNTMQMHEDIFKHQVYISLKSYTVIVPYSQANVFMI